MQYSTLCVSLCLSCSVASLPSMSLARDEANARAPTRKAMSWRTSDEEKCWPHHRRHHHQPLPIHLSKHVPPDCARNTARFPTFALSHCPSSPSDTPSIREHRPSRSIPGLAEFRLEMGPRRSSRVLLQHEQRLRRGTSLYDFPRN